MKKNKVKIIYAIAIFIITISLLTTTCSAELDISIITNPSNGDINSALQGFMENAAGFAQIVAAGVATVMLLMLAIKYMTASAGEKADVKQHAVVYIVGALLLYSGVAVVELIKTFMGGL